MLSESGLKDLEMTCALYVSKIQGGRGHIAQLS